MYNESLLEAEGWSYMIVNRFVYVLVYSDQFRLNILNIQKSA